MDAGCIGKHQQQEDQHLPKWKSDGSAMPEIRNTCDGAHAPQDTSPLFPLSEGIPSLTIKRVEMLRLDDITRCFVQ